MANDVLQLPSGWRQIRRETKLNGSANCIRVRRSGDLALGSDFVRSAAVGQSTRANLYVSSCGYRIGIRFHSDDADIDSFQVSKDGGNKLRDTGGRVIQVSSLKNQSEVLAKTLSLPERQREFEPRRDVNGLWVIELRPVFETRYAGRKAEIAANVSGIYRYVFGDDIVYIGRGRLLERLSSADRRDWEFDRIEYSILNNSEAEVRWESYWLDSFRSIFGRLPLYNRIAGQSKQAG